MELVGDVLEFVVVRLVPILLGLAYLAGLGLSIFLLIKSKAKAATLSTIAFAVLLLLHVLGPWAQPKIVDVTGDVLDSDVAHAMDQGLDCCCGVLQLAAIVCLVIAIQQAISPSVPKEVK
ncbi:MAG: hypothetical protein E3J64_06150 [Anaerolineales bacterium]|nr:MAG: hypothetical protein E3J64_06150 [Anaerolineales bacterium]